jgi:hypothetical protein
VELNRIFTLSKIPKPKPVLGPDDCSEEDSDFLKSKFAVDAIPDSLKYKDVKLFKIDDAEHPDEHIFIVVVALRLMKGFRNNGSL